MIIERKRGFYEKYLKRIIDIVCSLLAIILFSWIYIIIAVLVRVKLGSPVLFKQPRPGMINNKTGKEKIFNMYKFRTMTDEKGPDGELLSDEKRLTPFGSWLRKTSLDELPEAFNILKGDMSVIGPRPQLIRDMVFMTEKQRQRHTAKPGLSGLAQVKGRNAITWEEKIGWDLKYIEKVNFWRDFKLVIETIKVAFIKVEGITDGVNATALDYGDALLQNGEISMAQYEELQASARDIITEHLGK
jgi:lipopolysaccharide/colanic/teichoic acid biosynthesis glycosyltransferase